MATQCPKCQTENTKDSVYCKKCATLLKSAREISLTRTIVKPSDELSIGSTFADKYKVIAEIGRGGMGIVYKAEDIKLKRFVAIKLLPSELASDEEAKERFMQEAQAVAALSHPNICTIYEVEESEGKTYIAMEFIEGHSLRERTVNGPVSTEEALDVTIQVARGLAEAHNKGITHRDIKSANIIVNEKGQAKIMDFGLAKVRGAPLITKETKMLGTVAYMSPEQAKGEVVDHRTDIWSFGVLMYEMLTGELPFKGEHEATILYSITHEEPKSLENLKPPIPSELRQIINKALKKKRETRYQSAAEMSEDLIKYRDAQKAEAAGLFSARTFLKRIRQPRVAISIILSLICIALISVWFVHRKAKVRWAKNTALPEIKRLIDSGWTRYVEAYTLAQKAEKYIRDDPELLESLARCGMNISVQTKPPGASVYIKEYRAPESDWSFLGVSPIENVRVPFGFFRWKFEKEGYEQAVAVFSTFDWDLEKPSLTVPAKIFKMLDAKGSVPPGMVRVAGGSRGDFFMDEHEVTNREFKEFIDRGGYQKRDYWKHPFVHSEKVLTREKAMAEFLDTTGMPGPSTWEGGNYHEGQENYPVSGISWYEAAAYAEFAGKRLPTVSQWEIGAGLNLPTIFAGSFYLPSLASMSKFGGNGPAPIKSHPGITTCGAYDMAGNVREWCRDEAEKGRCLRGGAWSDVTYMFLPVSQAPAFDRSAKNGFRCIRSLSSDDTSEQIYQTVRFQESSDFYEENPIPDAIFQVYKEQFAYDQTDLEARLEARDESPADWIKEKISFNAAYENERMMIYLFLPRNASPPYQTVMVFPGSQAVFSSSSDKFEESTSFEFMDFIIRSGRALVYPIYKGTYERGNPSVYLPIHFGNSTRQYSEFVIKVVKDFKRSIDYLQTRKDIDINNIAYYGFSWGSMYGAIIPAIEERLKVSVLNAGGLPSQFLRPEKVRPEVDEINYITRVKIPTLMLNGMYDYHAFPLETSAKPMFELLGTSKEDKRQRIYDSDHTLPRSEFIRDTLYWFDRYLGPVKR